MDLCKLDLLVGAWYFIIFVHDRSRYTWNYFKRNKSYIVEYFKELKSMVEKQTGNCIKILRSNQGREYKSVEFNQYCKGNGILYKFTMPHTHQNNGVA